MEMKPIGIELRGGIRYYIACLGLGRDCDWRLGRIPQDYRVFHRKFRVYDNNGH